MEKYGTIKHVPNHQPAMRLDSEAFRERGVDMQKLKLETTHSAKSQHVLEKQQEQVDQRPTLKWCFTQRRETWPWDKFAWHQDHQACRRHKFPVKLGEIFTTKSTSVSS